MKLKTVFTINYMLLFIVGIGFFIMPAFLIELMGMEPAGHVGLVARGWGTFLLGSFSLVYFSRDIPKSKCRRGIVLSLFILYILFDLYKLSLILFSGISLTWAMGLFFLLHSFFVILYGYFLFGPPREIDQ